MKTQTQNVSKVNSNVVRNSKKVKKQAVKNVEPIVSHEEIQALTTDVVPVTEAETITETVVVKTKGRVPNPESKQQRAFAYYAADPSMARKDFIKYCVEVLGSKPLAASTYYVNARNNLKKSTVTV